MLQGVTLILSDIDAVADGADDALNGLGEGY